jgi:hypothetical protein
MPTIYVNPLPPAPVRGQPSNVIRYVGANSVPRDIRRHRANNLDTMRAYGTPVVLKKMYTDRDRRLGGAVPSPNYSSVYGQVRHDDPLSHGVGFVGAKDGVMIESIDEWYDTTGRDLRILTQDTSPGTGWAKAPLYRGFGPGYLTYAILPDVAEDVFKLTDAGVLIRSQTAQAQMGWYPEVNDNDLLIIVEIDEAERVIDARERFQLKMTTPISMRGIDRLGRREANEDFGNRHITDQQFEMTLIPETDKLYDVEWDR